MRLRQLFNNSNIRGGRAHVRVLLKAIGITLVAFLLSTFMTAPFTASTSILFSSSEQSDFKFSDIFAQFADSRPVRQLEDRFLILDIGNSNREEIAEALTMLSLCNPKAVGIDILFGAPGENDSTLVSALAGLSCPVVMPRIAADSAGVFSIAERSFLESYAELSALRYAAVNLPTDGSEGHGRVREYAVCFPLAGGDTLWSMPMALTQIMDAKAAERLKSRHAAYGTVAYASRQFNVITPEQISEHAADIENRTVLVGSLNDAYDMHATPVNSYYPGVMIHAHALSTILDGTWFRKAPDYTDPLVASLVCFTIVYLCLILNPGIRGLLLRLLQILLLYITVRIGYELYVEHNTICNFSYTLLMIAFGLFSVDIWNGVLFVGRKVSGRIHNMTTKQDSERCKELS